MNDYDGWLQKVMRLAFHSHCYAPAEMDDLPYREWYDAGLTCEDAARRAEGEVWWGTHPPGIRDNF